MDKQIFSASSVTKILNLSATSEMARAFKSAIIKKVMNSDANPATTASWWRNKEGFLFATQPTTRTIPECRQVQLKLDWGGYRPAA